MQSHRMHDAIPTLQKIHALRESCAKCYFCQGGLKLLLTTVYMNMCKQFSVFLFMYVERTNQCLMTFHHDIYNWVSNKERRK